MNYSAVALFLLMLYLWYAGSIMHEIKYIKNLLFLTYKMIESNFNKLTIDFHLFRDESLRLFQVLQNNTKYTIELVLENSKKIDVINDNVLNKN